MLAMLAAGTALLLWAPASAAADTVVPAGQTVVEITTFGQDVTLNGTSAGSVIVIGGDLTIGPHGRAGDGVTVIGGELRTAPSATVHGDVLQVGGRIPHPSAWMLTATVAALIAARLLGVWLILRLASIFEGWATTTKVLAASRRRPLRSTLVGALLAAGILAAGLLLALSIVGLLFAVALGGVLLLAAALGIAFVLQPLRDARHRHTITLALAVPLVGDALLAMATLVALGAAFHYLVDERTASTAPIPAEP